MSRTTSVDLADAGPVVRHQAPAGPEAEVLRREATVLALARGPGVVDLVDAGDDDAGGAWLTTRYVPGGTLVDVARTQGARAAVLATAGVAATLADLHDRGIVHRRCRPDHVLGPPDQPVLCGFAYASVAVLDGSVDPGEDIDAFATMVLSVCTSREEPAERARVAVTGLVSDPPTSDLRTASAALRVAAGLAGSSPPAPEPTTGPQGRVIAPRRPRTPPPRRRRAVQATAAAVLVLAAVLLPGMRGRGTGDRAATPADSRPDEDVGAGSERRDSTRPGGAAPSSGTPGPYGDTGATPPDGAVTTPAPADPRAPGGRPGGGSAGTVGPHTTVAAGAGPAPPPDGTDDVVSVVEHGGVRYRVGAPGDLVVVADWDCDGVVTPAVVRRADGSVWTFPTWAPAGEVVAARAVGHVGPPASAAAAEGPDGCDVLAVTTTDGRQVLVELPDG